MSDSAAVPFLQGFVIHTRHKCKLLIVLPDLIIFSYRNSLFIYIIFLSQLDTLDDCEYRLKSVWKKEIVGYFVIITVIKLGVGTE